MSLSESFLPLHGSAIFDILNDSQDGRCSSNDAIDKEDDVNVLRALVKDQKDRLEFHKKRIESLERQLHQLKSTSLTAPDNGDMRELIDSAVTELNNIYIANGLDPSEIPDRIENGLGGKELDHILLFHPALMNEILTLRAELYKKNQEVRKREEEAHCLQFSVESTLGRRLYDKLRDVQRENCELGNIINDTRILPVEMGIRALHAKVDQLTEGMRNLNEVNKEVRNENEYLHSKLEEVVQLKMDLQKECAAMQAKKDSKAYQDRSDAKERAPDRVSDRAPDRVSDRAPDRVSDRAPDRVSDRAPDRVSDRAPDRVSDRAPDRVSDRAPDRVSDRHDREREEHRKISYEFNNRKGEDRKKNARSRIMRPPSRERRERRR